MLQLNMSFIVLYASVFIESGESISVLLHATSNPQKVIILKLLNAASLKLSVTVAASLPPCFSISLCKLFHRPYPCPDPG